MSHGASLSPPGPAELLEQALHSYGDALYRFALLLAGEERAAATLVRSWAAERVAAWRSAPPTTPPVEPELVAALVTAARAAEAKPPRRQPLIRPRLRPVAFGPFALVRLPLEQRAALALHLLFGYDGPRLAAALGGSPEQARATLVAAVRALGPTTGHSLTDRVSDANCGPVRDALIDPTAGSRHSSATRAHLAGCALCRSFDQAWSEIVHRVEDAVRTALRDRPLPAALAGSLVSAAQPRRRRFNPSLRLALVPLAALALIAVLILPGFLRTPTVVVEREPGAVVDPQALLSMALARQQDSPDRSAVWYGRYRTEWFFDDNVYAPLTAEIWLDPQNPARHRLQLTHADGGAPYELQLGNGSDRLYYALDATYAPALYGDFPNRPYPESPGLVSQGLDAEGQRRAREERLATGPWTIAPSYLRQAQAASDLRALGRQRLGDRTVEILSFSGVSPLAPPADAPDATPQRVTVLLALDTEDGLLRSATELSGPAGTEQTSRVTWRLESEQLLRGTQERDAFDINRAWTGQGEFGDDRRVRSADLALPLIPARFLADPALLLNSDANFGPIWMPAQAPAGTDRALLIWPSADSDRGAPPVGLVYLGEGRRMLIGFNTIRQVEGETLSEGVWSVNLRPAAGGRYSLSLQRPTDEAGLGATSVDPTSNLVIDAFGFSRAELLDVVRGLRPFDIEVLAAQDALFLGRNGDPQARSLLLQVVQNSLAVPVGSAGFLLATSFSRQSPPSPDARQDPFHAPPYGGMPETTAVAEWWQNRDGPVRYAEIKDPLDEMLYSSFYSSSDESWYYQPQPDTLTAYSDLFAPSYTLLPLPARTALEMITTPGGEITLARLPGGGNAISRSEDARENWRYSWLLSRREGGTPHLYDIQPISITTELRLDRAGLPQRVDVFAVPEFDRPVLVERFTIEEQGQRPLAEAPAALRDGALPQAAYTTDFRGDGGVFWDQGTLVTRTLTEALTLRDRELYLLDDAQLILVQDGPTERPANVYLDAFLDMAVYQGYALRLTYAIPPLEPGGPAGELKLTQGPAAALTAYLRSQPDTPWSSSDPVRLNIAGQQREAWLGVGPRNYLIAEVDGTLLVFDAPSGWYRSGGAAILADLRLAPRP